MLTVDFVAIVRLSNTFHELHPVSFGNSNELLIGQQVSVIGSPFGCISPNAFFNSISTGVISHSFHGPNGSADLVLTDARCLPGNEGGGVFDPAGRLIGIVAPHLTTTDKPMDLNFIIPSNPIASLLSSIMRVPEKNGTNSDTFLPRNVVGAKKSIVCLQVGNSWASGFVVSKNGHILTNAHLFNTSVKDLARPKPIPPQEYSHLRVVVYFGKPADTSSNPSLPTNTSQINTAKGCVRAKVIYLSHTHLDVALLQVEGEEDRMQMNELLVPIKKSLSVEASIGLPIWLVAHGFAPEKGMDVVCSYGTIANVILRDGVPASIQTSASVHSGNSGGLLINSDGNLVGMVMSHTTHKSSRTFTRLNFAIPYHQFITLINYANGEDPQAIQRLQQLPTDNFLASLWKFEPKEPERPAGGQNFRDFVEKMRLSDNKIPLRPLPISKL